MKKKVLCFGEILWDIFPEGKKIGGAPLNVALRLQELGVESNIISAIGNDELGNKILNQLNGLKAGSRFIQTIDQYPTGTVQVTLDVKGSASYKITDGVAWDYIKLNKEITNAITQTDMLVFGSLACRNTESKKTLESLISASKFCVFDVNLRPPFYNLPLLEELMLASDFIKFNDEELYEIALQLNSPYHSLDQHIAFLSQHTNTQHICVTKGGFGAVLYSNGDYIYHSGFRVEIKDTVGAGDSFLATLIEGFLNKRDLKESLTKACAVGALVAASSGANSKILEKDLLEFIR